MQSERNFARILPSSRKVQPKRNGVSVRKIRDLIFMKTNVYKDLNKQVLVFNPKDRPTDLRNHAAKCIDIPRDLPLRCQLPDIIPVGTHGNTIHRPSAWAKSTTPEC